MLQELKEQQARLRAQAQHQHQYKSPNSLEEAHQTRKSPQSQTAQRDHHLNYASQKKPTNGGSTNERNLQELRDAHKYQLSKDKYSLLQVPNAHQNGQSSPKVQTLGGSGVKPGQQGGNIMSSAMTNMNLVMSTGNANNKNVLLNQQQPQGSNKQVI